MEEIEAYFGRIEGAVSSIRNRLGNINLICQESTGEKMSEFMRAYDAESAKVCASKEFNLFQELVGQLKTVDMIIDEVNSVTGTLKRAESVNRSLVI